MIDSPLQKSLTQCMALRVLLADESSTIKKVFQLSLQDYAVDVKSVNIGSDVREIAEKFKPDIIFADVLLQQKSGYEVSSELKGDDLLKKTPIVLMWSGFMDLDEDKFQASLADAKLEKPFEVNHLRGLINSLVPKTKEQNLSHYLKFPDMPNFDEVKSSDEKQKNLPPMSNSSKAPLPKQASVTPIKSTEIVLDDKNVATSGWGMDSFDDVHDFSKLDTAHAEEFSTIDLSNKMPDRNLKDKNDDRKLLTEDIDEGSDWVQGDIDDFKLDIEVDDNVNADDDELPVEAVIPKATLDRLNKTRKYKAEIEPEEDPNHRSDPRDLELEDELPSHESKATPVTQDLLTPMSEEQLAAIIRSQSKEMLEKMIWEIVPELATQIIEREISRLLNEKSK